MRSNIVVQTLVGTVAAVAVAITGAGIAAAAPAQPTVSAQAFAPLAVNNLGLSTGEAANLQRWLQKWRGCSLSADGELGPQSWACLQGFLYDYGYQGSQDGIVGSLTIKALQTYLKEYWSYTGGIDGVAGDGTKAAFRRWADNLSGV